MAKLVINPTSASKKEIPIGSRVISIGRDPSNDLVLSDSMVSRRHAILEQRDDIFVLRDNNSSNGTLVNGDKVEAEKTLRDGDLVAIGSSRLLFQLEDGAAAPVAAPDSAGVADVAEPGAPESPVAKPEVASVTCPSCGKKSLVTDRFCRACGSELEKKTSIACTACGTTVPLPAEFCGNCGHELPRKHRAAAFPTRANKRSELLGEPVDTDAKASKPSAAARRPRPGKPVSPRKEEEAAGFAIRFVAALVDSMILGIPLLVATLLWGTFALDSGDGAPPIPEGSLAIVSLGFPLICLAYYVFFWGVRGATPGKGLLGLSVQTDDGETPIGVQRAALRVVGYLVSTLILGLGFVMIAFSDDKRALHDRVAGTRVMRNL